MKTKQPAYQIILTHYFIRKFLVLFTKRELFRIFLQHANCMAPSFIQRYIEQFLKFLTRTRHGVNFFNMNSCYDVFHPVEFN